VEIKEDTFVGHSRTRASLEKNLPSVALLRGPESVGKWTLALHLAKHHGIAPVDSRFINPLTTAASRELKSFAMSAPLSGQAKLLVINLDGASPSSLNALLKILEEPPGHVRFILVSTGATLVTIESRAQIFLLGFLTREESYAILTQKGFTSREAAMAAAYGQGQVSRAMSVVIIETVKVTVLTLLKSIADTNIELFERVAEKWTADASHLLESWCMEAMTQRWRVFNEGETFGLAGTKYPLAILQSLSVLDARPKISIRVAIIPVLEAKKNSER
jgi:hypothetical protein